LLPLIISPTQTFAQENWVINSFDSEIRILENGKVSVVETIDVDFGSLQKHGIFRDLPFVYTTSGGGKRYTEVGVEQVTVGNSSVPYETNKSGDFIELKIGDPDRTVSGTQSYRIQYTVAGVLNSFEGYDELYWNVTGNGWPVPIQKASATVVLPDDAIVQITCFAGVVGSKENCTSDQTSKKEASFSSSRLGVGEGLTIVVGYEKGLVPIITVAPPKSIFDSLFTPANLAVFALVTFLGVGSVFWLWFSRGRDYWLRKRFIDDPAAKHEVRPVGAHETIVVEYSPPEKLRPAQIGTLMDERADTLDVTATIVDLAQRGFLQIAEEPKKWIFGSSDYTLTKQKTDESRLLPYEKELLDRLFDDGETVKISKLKTKFYEDLKVVKDKLYDQMIKDRFFYENPESVRKKYLFFGIGVDAVGAGLIWVGLAFTLAIMVVLGAAIIISGAALIVFSQSMPRKTALGREMYRRTKGLELFISTAEKHRQHFFEKKNMFNEILPYAIVFGLTEKFAKAFKDMGIEPSQPTWYSGTAPFNAAVFGASMSSFSDSLSSAMAAAPGGSGLSGGGGFSGGGFGGGGGGSW